MNRSMHDTSSKTIVLSGSQNKFGEQVLKRAGTNFNRCLHCQSCASGCPFTGAMDYLPNRIIRLVQFGQIQPALESATIWACVACNTCSIQCPMAIDIPGVMDALRQMAIENGHQIAEPDVLNFHREVLNTIERYGRTHKLEIMLRYKIKKRDWFTDLNVGLKMLAKRKLDLTPSRVSDIGRIRQLFKKSSKDA